MSLVKMLRVWERAAVSLELSFFLEDGLASLDVVILGVKFGNRRELK